MSDPDFRGLRDADAPRPGEHERTAVEERAQELRGRARRRRALGSGLALIVATAVVAGVVVTRHDAGPSVSVTAPSSTVAPTSSANDRFVPPTSVANGLVVLPVTLPDGRTLTIRYPPALRLAQLGFAGGIGVDWPVAPTPTRCCGRQIGIGYTTIARVYGHAKPVRVYRGANGEPVPYFHAGQAIPPAPNPIDYLVFQFGPWLVHVYDPQHRETYEDRMTDAQRATWARSLTGSVDANGYLVLHTRAPLVLSNDFDGLFGAGVAGTNQFEIAEQRCDPTASKPGVRERFADGDGTPGVSWCDGGLHFRAVGSPAFVDLVAKELQVGAVTAPTVSAPTTTSTTTTPPLTDSRAVSASFVSAQQGWVLKQNGTLVGTLDGGATWHAVGSLGRTGLNMRVRFADASHGFAFDAGSNADAPLSATVDAGAHWKQLKTPFSSVTDLAISRGRVYVTGVHTKNGEFDGFRIWSTPADRMQWEMDPIHVPIGAGPVPAQQLVFAGGHGWIVNNDRQVESGARLPAPAARWASWSPPCPGGAPYLGASTDADLVLSCTEGIWTGPKITTGIYFSHDAGTTFRRRSAPAAGQVISPDPATAVIADGPTLRRTTDEGATWHVVGHAATDTGAATDLGFTTRTQGFVIFGDDEMLMTHDAGATWKPATLR